ncbi:conserved hypothetical protein [Vibrio chagasii]|nr:conserved hypothetical protein [Vibrio chagasii]
MTFENINEHSKLICGINMETVPKLSKESEFYFLTELVQGMPIVAHKHYDVISGVHSCKVKVKEFETLASVVVETDEEYLFISNDLLTVYNVDGREPVTPIIGNNTKSPYELGVIAHGNNHNTPAQDPNMMNWIKYHTKQVGDGIPAMEEWYKGFNEMVDEECAKLLEQETAA